MSLDTARRPCAADIIALLLLTVLFSARDGKTITVYAGTTINAAATATL
jgi:hypothetical protein